MTIREIAQTYIDAGWSVVPLVKGEKRASSSWQKRTYTAADFGPDDGIAGKCGQASGWRVDTDLDSPEAIAAAQRLLPNTGLVHGRPGKRTSHFWFICEGIKTTQFTDIKDASGKSAMLVEIRSDNGYTVLPPSTHPSGEVLAWTDEGAPMRISPEDLYAIVRDVAIAALVARHWPGPGARHSMIGPLAGLLCSAKIDGPQVVRIIETAAIVAGDSDVHDRVNFARNTVAKFKAGESVTGGPSLVDALGEAVVAKLRAWLKVADLDAIEAMNARHFVVTMGKDEVIGTEKGSVVLFQHPRALRIRYANRRVQVGVDAQGNARFRPLFDAWLESPTRRDYNEVVFQPPPHEADPRNYNLWRGFAIAPQPGSYPLFTQHLRKVICAGNDEHYEYLRKLLALTVQRPGVPSEVATVLRGEPGTGKGTFVRALMDIFGQHATHLSDRQQLVGHFNAPLSGKVIVFADEAIWAGDKREVGALKRLITEPTLTIERKGLDAVQERNCVHLFVATNDEWAIPAMLKERRYLALNVASDRRGDTAYFDALNAELADGGLAGFLHDLLALPVSADEVRHVPKTAELRVQQSQSQPDEFKWLEECLVDRYVPFVIDEARWSQPVQGHLMNQQHPREVQPAQVYHAYVTWMATRRRDPLTKIEFSRRMGLLWEGRSRSERVSGAVVKVRVLKSIADVRAAYDAEMGTQVDWDAAA